jgi:DNA mismatch endonuclease (patch repair protein)
MQRNRRTDTTPELALRRLLHADGLRFRKDFRLTAGGVRTTADIAFTRQRVAVFVDGCFWHGCPEHGRLPTRNAAYWRAKIERNRRRDLQVTTALGQAGWRVVRVWEHEALEDAAARVRRALSGS